MVHANVHRGKVGQRREWTSLISGMRPFINRSISNCTMEDLTEQLRIEAEKLKNGELPLLPILHCTRRLFGRSGLPVMSCGLRCA